jgi:pre-mRNA-processing factor 6
LQKGLAQCNTNAVLWRLSVRLEEQLRGVNKARSVAEMARLKLPLCEEVWLESIRLERRNGCEKLAESLSAQALKQFPLSGMLCAEDLLSCPKTAQKSK